MAHNAIKQIQSREFDLLTCKKEVITGLFTFAFTRDSIKKLFSLVKDQNIDTDIIVKFIEKSKLKIGYLQYSEFEMNKEIRLTLDYQEDLEFFKKLYSMNNITTPTIDIIRFLIDNPDVAKINFCKQSDFLKNQERFNNSVEL
jgi:spore coat polysaccharide biosynthesis protein SpsF (cytidylyltransferase family)